MSKLVKLQIYPEELLYLVSLQVNLIYGGGKLVVSTSLLFEEITYLMNEK